MANKSQLHSPRGTLDGEAERRMNESLDPVPISKEEKLTKGDNGADMKLVQQYVMIRGRLQPALKYVAQIPMFNRYKVKNSAKEDFQEIMTYPTITGDLKMKNKHVGVNFDDRDIPQKALPNEMIESDKREDLEGVVKKLQNKNIRYNK